MRLDEAFRALREESANSQASARVEADVLAAFRAQKKRRSVAPWVLAIAAAVLVTGFVSVLVNRPKPAPPTVAPVATIRPETSAATKVEVPVQAAVAPVVKKRPARKPVVVAKSLKDAPLETWSDFVPVPYAPPLHAGDGAQLLRVRLPRNTLQSFGIPMPADRMYDRFNAEVMVGQDGVVRAIRFAK